LLAISVDEPPAERLVRSFQQELGLDLPLLLATAEVVGVYNVLARRFFDRVADLAIPTSLLIDERGSIVKVYRGAISVDEITKDSGRIPQSPGERVALGLPFSGRNLGAKFLRNPFELANDFAERGYSRQAEAYYEESARLSPSQAKVHFNLGTLRANEGRLEEAIEAFDKALAADPQYASAYANMGSVYARQGRLAESAKSLERALALDPSQADAHNNLGNVYAAQGELSRAREAYRQAIGARPDFAEAHNNLGVLDGRLGRLPEAVASFEKAVALRPDYAEALLNLGNVLAQARRPEEAVIPLRKAHQLAPSPQSCISLILACVEAGYLPEAQAVARAGLEQWKGNPDLEILARELGVVQ
jgi:tetratricopeptide (TPR) repeat protein